MSEDGDPLFFLFGVCLCIIGAITDSLLTVVIGSLIACAMFLRSLG